MNEVIHAAVIEPEAREVEPGPVSAQEALGTIQAMKAGNRWQEMIRAFHPLEERLPHLAGSPQRGVILQEVAFALSQEKRFAEAIQLLRTCEEERPDQYGVVAALAFNHYNALMSDKIREIRLGDRKAEYVEEADRWFRRAEEVHPRTVVDFYRHGMLYHHILTNQDKKALPLLNRAVANWEGLTPEQQERRHKDRRNYIKALYHLGKAHLNLGRYEEGEKLARKCIDADRETDYEEPIHKFYLLGKILLKAGHLEDALSHLRTAAGMRTQRPKDYVFCATAQCLAGLERHEEALQWLERTPPKFRKPHVKRLMGWIQYKLGRADEAGRLLEEALVGGPKGRHLTFLVMGEICRELGRWRDAANYFRKANEAKRKEFLNDFDDALYRLGMCLLRLGDRDGARDAFRRTLLVNDRHHEAARAMRELLAETGGVDGPPSDRGESNP